MDGVIEQMAADRAEVQAEQARLLKLRNEVVELLSQANEPDLLACKEILLP